MQKRFFGVAGLAWIAAFLVAFAVEVESATFRVSTAEPVVVTAPSDWQISTDRPASPQYPFESFRISAKDGRNAVCMVSLVGKNKDDFADKDFVKKVCIAQGRPFVKSPEELKRVDPRELKIEGGHGCYVDFVDPDLVGKPTAKGQYKVATPVILSIGTKYLIHATILTDDADGADHRELMNMLETIRVMRLI